MKLIKWKVFPQSEFTLYKYFDFLIENPKDTINQTCDFFIENLMFHFNNRSKYISSI